MNKAPPRFGNNMELGFDEPEDFTQQKHAKLPPKPEDTTLKLPEHVKPADALKAFMQVKPKPKQPKGKQP